MNYTLTCKLAALAVVVATLTPATVSLAADSTTANAGALETAALSVTERSLNKAQSVVDRAVQAYGGEEAVNGITTIVQTFKSSFNAVGQSRKPGPPWDKDSSGGLRAINLLEQVFVSREFDTQEHYDYDFAQVTRKDGTGIQLDYRAQTQTGLTDRDFDRNTGPHTRVTPVLLVRELLKRSNTTHYLGQDEIDGRPHDIISLVMTTGPAISLYVDTKTGLITRSERVLPGAGLVGYRFLDYRGESGIPFNQRFELHVAGELSEERRNTSIKINGDVSRYTAPAVKFKRTGTAPADQFSSQQLAPGVYLVGGEGTYGLFVDVGKEIIAIGGTGGAAARLERIKKELPGKAVTYGVMTHHHSDHILAASTYAEQGITVIGATAHEQAITRVMPETSATFEGVDRRRTFEGESRVLEIIDVGPTTHSENLLVAWLPKEKILFEADHFNVPHTGQVPPANSNTRSFAEALKRAGLKPATIASAHSNRTGSMKDLRAALRKKPSLKHRVESAR